MSLAELQQRHKTNLESQVQRLLDLLQQSEQVRDLSSAPVERGRYDLEVTRLKEELDKYKRELAILEGEIEAASASNRHRGTRVASYRIALDDNLPEPQLSESFRKEVHGLLEILDYEISPAPITGLTADTPPTFLAVQDGPFDPVRTLFQVTPGIIDDKRMTDFHYVFDRNRDPLGLHNAVLITNTYVAPSARQLGSERQIQVRTFEDLIDSVFKLAAYLKTRCHEYETNNTLFRTYVEIKYLRRGKGKYPDALATPKEDLFKQEAGDGAFEAKGELTSYVDNWVRGDEGGQICLLGDYGTGKTSFATQYFWRAANAYLENPTKNRIPLLIPLNRYHKSADVEQMITGFLVNECGVRRNFKTFLRLASLGKFLVILDGFDEMAKQVDVRVRSHNFRQLARLVVGRNKVILSGRPNYFLQQEEIDEVFGAGSATETDPYRMAAHVATSRGPRYDILAITLFDRWQIEEFLRKQSAYLAERGIEDWRELQKTIQTTYNLEELARTPVLLEIIIKTLSELRGKVADINAARLYEIYTDFWLDREYDDKGEVRWLITREAKELFVMELAWSMLLTDSTRPEIHYSQLSKRVEAYFKIDRASELEYFSSDIRFCSYLVHSTADGTYRFVHKSFMEYFCARYILKAVVNERNIATVATSKTLPDEVFFFLCQLAGDGGLDTVLALADEQHSDEHKAFAARLGRQMLQHFIESDLARGLIEPVDRRLARMMEHCTRVGDEDGLTWAWLTSGTKSMRYGNLQEAEAAYSKALTLAEARNDRHSTSTATMSLGRIATTKGDLDGARTRYTSALELLEGEGDTRERWQALFEIGNLHRFGGDLTRARETLDRALQVAEGINDRAAIAETLVMIGRVLSSSGAYPDALTSLKRAQTILKETADRRSEGVVGLDIADVCRQVGLLTDAEVALENARQSFIEVGSALEESRALISLGELAAQKGDHEAAAVRFRHALEISRKLGQTGDQCVALTHLGDVALAQNRPAEALDLQQRALHLSRETRDVRGIVSALSSMAQTLSRLDRFEDARRSYEEARGILEATGDRPGARRIKQRLGDLAQRQDRFAEAGDYYNAALDEARQSTDKLGEADLFESLGDLAVKTETLDRAEQCYESSLDICQDLGVTHRAADLHLKLARLARAQANPEKFLERYTKYRRLAEQLERTIPADIEEEFRRHLASTKGPEFALGTPVANSSGFWGRSLEIDEVVTRLRTGQSVLILGERRIGKTSFLLELHRSLQRPLVPVYINLQAFLNQPEVIADGILRKIVDRLVQDGLVLRERWDRTSVSYAREFAEALRSLTHEAKETLPEFRLVLLIDEIEVLAGASRSVAGMLRAVLSEIEEVVAVFAGGATVASVFNKDDQTSPLWNIMTPLQLGPLSQQDEAEFLADVAQQAQVEFEPDALAAFHQWTGGYPYLMQVTAAAVASHVQSVNNATVSLDDLDEVRDSVLNSLNPLFGSLFFSLPEKDQKALLALVNPSERGSHDATQRQLRRLVSHGILREREGKYACASGLFKAWVRAYGSVL